MRPALPSPERPTSPQNRPTAPDVEKSHERQATDVTGFAVEKDDRAGDIVSVQMVSSGVVVLATDGFTPVARDLRWAIPLCMDTDGAKVGDLLK